MGRSREEASIVIGGQGPYSKSYQGPCGRLAGLLNNLEERADGVCGSGVIWHKDTDRGRSR